jgi:hypothetical protein
MRAKFLFEIIKGRHCSEDVDVDGRIILKRVFGEIGFEGVD